MYLIYPLKCITLQSLLLFSPSVMSDSLWAHRLQHARLPSPTPSPRVGSDSYPLSQWCHPLSPSLSSHSPSDFSLSQHQGLFQWVGCSHQVAKVLQLHFSISPSNEYSGLISFRIDRFDLLAVQETLKSLLQHHNSKSSVLWWSAFYCPTFTSIHDYWKNSHV